MKKVSVINEITADEPILRKFKKDDRVIRQWIEVPLSHEGEEIELKIKGSMTVIQRENDTFALGISNFDGYEKLEKIIQKKAEEIKPQVKKHFYHFPNIVEQIFTSSKNMKKIIQKIG